MEKIKKVEELEKFESEIIQLVSKYGNNKWTKIARILSSMHLLEIRPYQVKRFYTTLDVAKVGNIKKDIPEMIPLYTDLLFTMLGALDRLEAVTPETKAAPGYYMAFTTLVKTIIDLRNEIAEATGETAWNTRVMTVIRECTEFFTKILQKHLPKEKVLEIILDWNNIIPAVNERNRI
ncbi:MAG: hypothetical protein WC614_07545 [bacterium]